jgi:hypothetical protein
MRRAAAGTIRYPRADEQYSQLLLQGQICNHLSEESPSRENFSLEAAKWAP